MTNAVKWIKLTTDMFDNRKIKHLRRLPDGNNIVLIWVMLLTMAGRCNSNGIIFLTENIPYTPEMLADELDFEEKTVQLALNAFEQLNMIVTNNEFFAIAGWEKYQNIDGMAKIREQNRLAQQRFREKRKLLNECEEAMSDDSNMTVILRNGTDIDKEEDKEERKRNNTNTNKPRKKPSKQPFIPPTLEEVQAYCESRGNKVDAKQFFDYFDAGNWIDSKGNPVKNWKQKVITWESNQNKTQQRKGSGASGNEEVGRSVGTWL